MLIKSIGSRSHDSISIFFLLLCCSAFCQHLREFKKKVSSFKIQFLVQFHMSLIDIRREYPENLWLHNWIILVSFFHFLFPFFWQRTLFLQCFSNLVLTEGKTLVKLFSISIIYQEDLEHISKYEWILF